MVMNDGAIVEIADADALYREPRDPYTQRLLAAIPRGWQPRAPLPA
jgi:peptide/nickel transport system ATP-binding protein